MTEHERKERSAARPARRLLLVALAAAVVSACGRRGALQMPDQPVETEEPAS